METRLIQRFKWGLTAEILTPDFDTRVKIIKAKSANEGIVLPDEIVNYLASKVTGSVRELEGTILTLLAHSTFNKESITLDLAKKVTQQIVNVDSSEISLERIRNTVCDYFKISPETIVSKTRKREIVQARQIAMYLVRNLTKTSLTSIGSQMGGKDHATVLHACSTVSDLIDTDRNIRRYVADLERQLKGGK
jgi:chromosomal replication initiator protein